MFEEFVKKVIENAVQEAKQRKEAETNSLMSEITNFHITQVIDKALETKDQKAFEILVKIKNDRLQTAAK
ncbi:hypothetical protein ACXYMX_00310 [Sporosarcina sp. CAU 1771]